MILDGMGSSEGGGQMTQVSMAGADVTTGTFTPSAGTCIVSEDFTRVLEPGADEVGWVAMRGHVPLGYFGDPEKSARTFPVIDGVRYSIPGDRGRQRADGTVEMLGRDSVTINSGGEKIFAEEVEAALGHHPAVYDAVVCGRPSEKWGQEVVAIVQLRDGVEPAPRWNVRCSTSPPSTSLGTSSRRRSCSSIVLSGLRRARPTTGGPRRSPPLTRDDGRV